MKTTILALILALSQAAHAKDYIIYAVSQNLPMGEPEEVITKNYYVNIGQQQGLKTGSVLNVYRSVAMSDPYETKNKYNHKVKIGELKILHTEDGSAIARLEKFAEGKDVPVFDIENFMIGDRVQVKVD